MQSSHEVGKIGGRNTRETTTADQQTQEAGKMGKSKGASAFSELLKNHAGETIRFFLLSTHYRRPIDFSEARIEEVNTGLEQFYRFFKRYERIAGASFYQLPYAVQRAAGDFEPGTCATRGEIAAGRGRFLQAMDDDFNTGGAVGDLFELVRTLNKFADDEKLEAKPPTAEQLATLRQGATTLRELGATLGLFRAPPAQAAATPGDNALVDKLMGLVIELRAGARGKKDFATADRIRDVLTELGITLEDRPGGTEWTVKGAPPRCASWASIPV
jgi:cysteinyl-tRNA synthetase